MRHHLAAHAMDLGAVPLTDRVPCEGHPEPEETPSAFPPDWASEETKRAFARLRRLRADARQREIIQRGIRTGAEKRANEYARWRRESPPYPDAEE